MAVLPKAINRFKAMLRKILHSPQNYTQLHMEKQKTQDIQTILYSKETSGDIITLTLNSNTEVEC